MSNISEKETVGNNNLGTSALMLSGGQELRFGVGGGVTPGDKQGLFLTLSQGMLLAVAGKTISGTWEQTRIGLLQDKCLSP